MRKEYLAGKLNEEECPEKPYQLFSEWFEQATALEAFEPNAFSLSTVDSDSKPHSRIVLLKYSQEDKFVFATNYSSNKAKDLDINSNAAILFYWQKLERQVRIEGKVYKTSIEESRDIFSKRPFGSKVGALASKQSSVIENREELESRYHQLLNEEKDYVCPEFWGGYYLVPEYYEFWQGRENRLHDRIAYEFDTKWNKKRLSP